MPHCRQIGNIAIRRLPWTLAGMTGRIYDRRQNVGYDFITLSLSSMLLVSPSEEVLLCNYAKCVNCVVKKPRQVRRLVGFMVNMADNVVHI